jgi:hypothetical protein
VEPVRAALWLLPETTATTLGLGVLAGLPTTARSNVTDVDAKLAVIVNEPSA